MVEAVPGPRLTAGILDSLALAAHLPSRGGHLMGFEHVSQPVASPIRFFFRLVWHTILAGAVLGASLGAGMWGYHTYEHMGWLDAFASAAMILSGMGPLAPLATPEGKLFAGSYALYSGVVFVATAGILLAPVVHRFLHRLHLDN
jgi:hypothetical protein